MSIRCGNHTEKTYHPTITDVRACFAGAVGGEPTYGDVILTTSELAKVAAGIRDMEDEGVLPRSRSRSSRPTFPDTRGGTIASDRAARVSPKGREIPTEFGGSPKQYDYMYELMEELGGVSPNFRWDVVTSTHLASKEIGRLKDAVRDARRLALAERTAPVRQTVTNSGTRITEDGIYRNRETGEIFKVQYAVHGSGNLYAKQAIIDTVDGSVTSIPLTGTLGESDHKVRVDWEYRPGLINKIDPSWRVTKAEAAAFGALYGRCIRCHRTLTREDSIERAMGPVCSGKMGW